MDLDTALAVVYQAIDTVNGQRPADQKLPKSPDLVLVGDGGVLDSLGLVTLVLTIERKLEEAAGVEVDLIGLEALNVEASELQTPGSIAQLIVDEVS